ncbi:chloride channel protein D [Exaiptasia diaphana]|uniref:Chloride channel protein n=1 Tax=Exaiptasia diaphana TaxID=2652724 RepID=A0A913X1Z9_EXADI|nr:chloride channel protein D [Exaiptasia diaphana]KXJ16127.1 Chloride channel protein D [Exaiptasia diaphana]
MSRRAKTYGVASGHADEDTLPTTTQTSFFQKGREFESAYVNHKYTDEEKEQLATYESVDYLPPHSSVYKKWLKQQPSRLDWDRWVMMGIIGFTVGFIGFLMHQLIDVIAELKWDKASEFIKEKDYALAWIWVMGYSVLFIIVSSVPVVYLRPSAQASGIPELIGFLNGTVVRHIFNVKTMVVKFFSCVCAVGAGLPIGPEGPMIHLGSLIGAGMSQFKSETLKLNLPFFERFRNTEDRRNFISAGAAAGVASAFGAPVGGLLFSMEEVSSFWNMKLSWQTFFCCMVSTFTTDIFNSAFEGFKYQGEFGLFKTNKYILFQVSHGLALNILAFIPTVILGVIGGLLGALFTFLNLKIARFRRYHIGSIKSKGWKNLAKLMEPIIIMIITATASVFLPAAFSCTPFECSFAQEGYSPKCLSTSHGPLHTERSVKNYTCPSGITVVYNGTQFTNASFNEVATLLFVTGEKAIHHLFSRDTHFELGYAALFTVLAVYFLLACWSAGSAVSSGLVVPMLFIGGVYGRIIGRAMVDLFGVHTTGYWAWMDPGAFALIGAASFFGGVSRLTMSLTVIMMEITNDIQFLLPIMVAIMVAKWVGDFTTHPLYHALLELKCIPFLDSEPVIFHENSKNVNLELFTASQAMTTPAIVVHKVENVQRLARLLLETPHGGYPVVQKDENGVEVFAGMISRNDISILLSREDVFSSRENLLPNEEEMDFSGIDYYLMNKGYLPHALELNETLHRYEENSRYGRLYIDLSPYVNDSAPTVRENFSLHRTYIIFRTLGLRHLVVVGKSNRVKGIITRKDLMGFQLEEKISDYIHEHVELRTSGSPETSTVTVG